MWRGKSRGDSTQAEREGVERQNDWDEERRAEGLDEDKRG